MTSYSHEAAPSQDIPATPTLRGTHAGAGALRPCGWRPPCEGPTVRGTGKLSPSCEVRLRALCQESRSLGPVLHADVSTLESTGAHPPPSPKDVCARGRAVWGFSMPFHLIQQLCWTPLCAAGTVWEGGQAPSWPPFGVHVAGSTAHHTGSRTPIS